MVLLLTTLASAALTDDLRVYYSFDNGDLTGNNPNDLTPNGFDGTNVNSSTTGVTGIIGEAFSFNKSNAQLVRFPDLRTFDQTGTTISYWFKTDSTSGSTDTMLGGRNSAGNASGTLLLMQPALHASGLMFLRYRDNGGTQLAPDWYTVQATNTGTWWHAVLTLNSTNATIWLNGSVSSSRANTFTTGINLGALYICADPYPNNGGRNWCSGTVDEIGVWNRSLSSSEISDLFNGGAGNQYPFSTPVDHNFSINVTDLFSGSHVTNFSVNITYNGSNWLVSGVNSPYETNITFNSSLVNLTVTKTNYFGNETVNHDTVTNASFSIRPYTAVRAFTIDGNAISNFTISYVSISNGSQSDTIATTAGLVWLPLFNTVYNVTISNAFYAGDDYQSKSVTLNVSPYLTGYNFTLFFSNSFLLQFRNETTNLPLVNKTVHLQLISGLYANNYTTVNGSINITLLVPDDYQLIYYYDPDVPREYYVTLTNQSAYNLTLYTIDEDIRSLYVPIENDQSGDECVNNTISLLRYYIDINGYRVVEMARTDTLGQAVLSVQANIINYKLAFTGGCGNFVTAPQKFIDSSNIYIVTGGQNPLTSFNQIGGVYRNLSFNNATNTYVYTWIDTTNLINKGCLEVSRSVNRTDSQLYFACSSGASGSLIYTINVSTNQSVFSASAWVETNTDFSTYGDGPLSIDFRDVQQVFGFTGVYMSILLVVAISLFASKSASLQLLGVAGGLLFTFWIGFVYGTWAGVIGVMIFASIYVWREW